MKKEIKIIIFIYLLIVVLKAVLVYFVPAPTAFGDSYTYAKVAREFFYFGTLSMHGSPLYVHPPLYSMILSIAYLFSDMRVVYFLFKLINVFVSSLVIFPSFLLAKDFLSEKKAIMVALLISLIPSNFSFSSYILAENLFYPLFLFSVYFLYKSFLSEEYKWDILAGISFGLVILTKSSGLILMVILFFASLAYFLKYGGLKKLILKKLTLLGFLLLTYLPWLIRNFSLFGFNVFSLGRDYYREASFLSGQLSPNFLSWIIMHLGCFILACGIILFICSMFFYKDFFKNKHVFLFSIISCFSLLITIYIASNHNIPDYKPFFWLMGRPIGRYIEFVLPLFFISGFAGLEKYSKERSSLKIPFLATIIVLLSSSFIIFYPLFPPNNFSLVWMGGIFYIFGLALSKSLNFQFVFNLEFLLLYFIIIISSLFLVYYLLKRVNIKSIFFILSSFFLLVSLFSYFFVYYDSYFIWYESGHNEIGLWFNDYDKGVSNVLFDERDSGEILKGDIINLNTGEGGIYEKSNVIKENLVNPDDWEKKMYNPSLSKLNNISRSFISIMGFWMNDNLYVGNVSNLEGMDYVVSKHKMNLQLIKKSKNDIFIYSARERDEI